MIPGVLTPVAHVEPRERADRQHHQVEGAAEQRHHQDGDQHVGNRIHHVDDAHHHRIGASADITGRGAPRDADQTGYQRAKQPDLERHASTGKRTHQQIAAELIGAEPVLAQQRGWHADGAPVVGGGVVGEEQRAYKAGNDDQPEDPQAGKRGTIA
jgi:hypothetical protein